MKSKNDEKIIELAKKLKILRVRDVMSQGIHPEYLRILTRQGRLVRIDRGLYALPGELTSEHQGLVQVLKRVPRGVGCLLTALQLHDIGTQNPRQVWVAIESRSAKPKITYPPVEFVRYSGKAFTEGIETRTIEGLKIKIYNPAKTVVDCFKHRSKVGLDVAQEALRDCLQQRKCTVSDLWRYAGICRITSVIKPYLEAAV